MTSGLEYQNQQRYTMYNITVTKLKLYGITFAQISRILPIPLDVFKIGNIFLHVYFKSSQKNYLHIN